jgi:DNA-binding FadR family transcriptional regulator
VLFGVLNHISDLILRTHLTTADRRGMRPQTMAMHDRIAAAIRARAPDEARRLMIEHIDNAAQHALRRLAPLGKPAPRGGKIKERG